ncbi:calexcitin-2-like [Maniola hyperantus]|uniref:calexcitin-2-like n=1 Tax=Aphantopus hyperantus TaxID=2795564 RepID=UPI00156A2602|nr:calexcitin-2-like [Maniola hyperantus]
MISEFRKMKYLYLFHAFFDTNSSGSIDKNDFEVAIENIAKLRGWKPEDEKYKETEKSLKDIWEGLEKAADANKDGQVSIEEWLTMWEEFAKNPSEPFEWQAMYCKFIFELEDASSDGVIDSEEFSTVHECFGLQKEDSEAAFKFMTRGKKTITWEEFQELWKQYFTSENPMDPGNFIFGAATY